MAGGIPISAKFDVAIAEPLDGKTESVATFTDLANTPFPFKGMQKLVEDEGFRGVLYYLGNDFTTWTKVGNEDALTQGTNTINNSGITSIAVSKTDSTPNLNATSLLYLDETLLSISSYSADNIGGFLNIASGADVANRVTQLGVTDVNDNTIDIKFNIDNGSILIENESGEGIKFNDRAIDEANVDFSTDDNNLLSIGKAKENLLQQGTNTLTDTLKLEIDDQGAISNSYLQVGVGGVTSFCSSYISNNISTVIAILDRTFSGVYNALGEQTSLDINIVDSSGVTIKDEILGKGIKFNDIAIDEANVDFSTDDNNLLSIGKAKENLQQKHTVTDFTDAFTIPDNTNNATLTMTNAVDKDVTISTTSFANVGDACELSSLLGVGYPIVVAGTGVALVDPNSVSSDSFNIKGLRRMNDVGGVIQIQLY